MAFRNSTLRFLLSDDGATAVEYSVVLALIVLAVFAAIGAVGSQSGGMWSGIKSDLDSHGFGR
jgi:pilus assembly protein Flp/PilA